jgi:uncharacterized protein (DUF488 family)
MRRTSESHVAVERPFFTIGHSTRPVEELIALLAAAEVQLLVDVRHIPRSRTNPQFNRDVLPVTLEPRGIDYRHFASLGGLRSKPRGGGESVNQLWRNSSFRNFADYALTREFAEGFAELLELGQARRTAIMCAEAVWWRCHRRVIADYLLQRGERVFHIMSRERFEPATLTPGAVPQPDGTLIYP